MLALLALTAISCDKSQFGRIDQMPDLPQPSPVEVSLRRTISGGAVLNIQIPDDDLIKGVVAVYERNGKEVKAKVSRFVDSLLVEGFADTDPHEVKVYSFNANERLSTPVTITITPLTPAIRTVTPTIFESFGGVKIHISGNVDREDLAVCLLRCADLADSSKAVKDIKWVEVTTLFTESDNINLVRRGLEPETAIFGAYLRDRWGNISDTSKIVLTPLLEEKIDKSKFKNAALKDDNCISESTNYPITGLWDDSGLSEKYHFFSSQSGPIPGWLTIDLGQVVQISRIQTLPRIGYTIWKNAHPRDFEFWGSMDPTGEEKEGNEHKFDDSWFCLGKFTQFKPSGYNADGSTGTCTTEDNMYFNSGNDFELDPDAYPRCYDELRYLRVVFANTFATFEYGANWGSVQFGEVTPWGQNESSRIKQ